MIKKISLLLLALVFFVGCGSSSDGDDVIISGTLQQLTFAKEESAEEADDEIQVPEIVTPIQLAVVSGLGNSDVTDKQGQFTILGDSTEAIPSVSNLLVTIPGTDTTDLIEVQTVGIAPFSVVLTRRPDGKYLVTVNSASLENDDGEG